MQYKIDQEKKEFIFTNEFPMLSAGEPYFVVVNKGELSLSAEGVEIISEPKQGISSLRTVGSDARLYDLQGRRIEGQPAKGLYISNGKKVVVK